MKSFKQFINEDYDAKDLVPEKDDDKEATEYKPRSKGEDNFAKSHKGSKEKHPHAKDNQFKGTTKDNSDHKGFSKKDAGEMNVVKPGTADVKGDEKDGSKKRDTSKAAGKNDGEKLKKN